MNGRLCGQGASRQCANSFVLRRDEVSKASTLDSSLCSESPCPCVGQMRGMKMTAGFLIVTPAQAGVQGKRSIFIAMTLGSE